MNYTIFDGYNTAIPGGGYGIPTSTTPSNANNPNGNSNTNANNANQYAMQQQQQMMALHRRQQLMAQQQQQRSASIASTDAGGPVHPHAQGSQTHPNNNLNPNNFNMNNLNNPSSSSADQQQHQLNQQLAMFQNASSGASGNQPTSFMAQQLQGFMGNSGNGSAPGSGLFQPQQQGDNQQQTGNANNTVGGGGGWRMPGMAGNGNNAGGNMLSGYGGGAGPAPQASFAGQPQGYNLLASLQNSGFNNQGGQQAFSAFGGGGGSGLTPGGGGAQHTLGNHGMGQQIIGGGQGNGNGVPYNNGQGNQQSGYAQQPSPNTNTTTTNSNPSAAPGASGMKIGMDRQWIQQSLRNQHHQQAQIQAQALAQARAGAGTPGGSASAAGGGGMSQQQQQQQQWASQNQQYGGPVSQGSFQQQQQQGTPSLQHMNAPQSAVTPGSSSNVGGGGRMSVPPRPSSAASAHSQFSTSLQHQQGIAGQSLGQGQGSIQGTPTQSLSTRALGGGPAGMQQGGMGQFGAGAQNAGYQQNISTANLQQSPGHAQHPHQPNQSSPMFTQPMGGNHLGVPPQMGGSQSPGSMMGNGNPGNSFLGGGGGGGGLSMGPPTSSSSTQRQQTPYQQFQISPASAGPATAGLMGMGTPTSMTGKRKTPGADSSREQSLVAGDQQSNATDGRKDGGPAKPAKQPRKKKEKEEKPAKPKKLPIKITKGQSKALDEHTQRLAELAAATTAEATAAEGSQAPQIKEEQSQSHVMPPPPLESMERNTTPALAIDTGLQFQSQPPAPPPSNFQQAQLELERIQQAQAQKSSPAAPPQPQVNANSDHSQTSVNNAAAAMYAALQNHKWPFDPRLVLHVKSVMQNPQTFPTIIARDPQLQEPMMKAIALIRAGKVSSETLNNMHKFAAAYAHLASQQRAVQQHRLSQSSQPPMTPRSPPAGGSQIPPAPVSQQPGSQSALASAIMSQLPPQMQHLTQRRDSQSSARQNQSEKMATRPLSGNPALAPPPLSAGLPADGGTIPLHTDVANTMLPPSTPASTRPAMPPPPPMEEWQKHLPNLPRMTSIAPLPQDIDEREDSTFGGALPLLTDEQLYQYRAWLDKDIEYARTLESQRARSANMVAEWLDKDVQPAWWQMDVRGERPALSERMSIIWPIEKKSARANKRPQKGRVKKSMADTKAEVKAVANIPERLVPIRLDIDVTDTNEEHRRYRDTFLWNAADPIGKLDKFVDTICEDFQIRPEKFKDKIRAAIEDQIKQGEFLLTLPGDDDPAGLSQEDCEWWQSQRLAIIEADQNTADLIEDEITEDNDVADDMDERPETVDALMADLPEQESAEDLRIKIQLDIVSGAMHLSDSFEWELTSSVSPEQFAEVYAAELGLNGEFKTAIAHDIREQVYLYMKSLAMVGYTFDGGAVTDLELRQEFLPPVTDVVRKDEQSIAIHTPFLVNITDADIERLETDREKLISKKKRATRGRRGIILPDREPVRTVRMRVGGEVDEHGRPLARVAGPKQPFIVKPSTLKKPITSRRAAALAARANISEMSNDVRDDKYDPVVAPVNNGRLKRNRPSAMTPGLQLEDPSNASPRVSSRISDRLFPKEERLSVPPDTASSKAVVNGSESRQGSVRPSDKARVSNKDGPVKTPGSRSRDDSPAPFPDVASPESTSSSSADGAFALGRAKSQAKRSIKNDRKIQTPLAQSSKPLPGSTPETSKPRSSGRVSESPAKITPVLSNLVIPPNRPPAHRVVSHQPPQPPWLVELLADLTAKRPRERVQATWKGPPANPPPGTTVTEVDHWRIKCLDCMGKIYSLGPGQTLDNFEKHLRNKQHLSNVEARTKET
ncbi:hypothetical protein QFC22_003655 [Naganishia vaughanmartiniae]|uniref:Uncharacterized protein n=1 Tax=Naganishia vaughanmartiniae TaxID=1424756 RepID=A0ACC2X6B1_9TREE|nr:hypothetical protein QFC22_003655 [Naganishia vaughanmartiniae]